MLQIFITGVSSGIGLSLASAYLKRGEQVFGMSRRSPPKQLLNCPTFRFQSMDLAELDQIDSKVCQLLTDVKSLDLVILNAAVLGRIADLVESTVAELKRIMDVNVWSNKVLLDGLLAKEIKVQQVVAISSGAADHPSRGFNGYAISKAALNMLIALYAAEQPKIHFSALAPGIVDTAMQAYVSSLPEDQRFPAVEMLKAARGTTCMPKPESVADRLIAAFQKARQYASGSFLNLEQMSA